MTKQASENTSKNEATADLEVEQEQAPGTTAESDSGEPDASAPESEAAFELELEADPSDPAQAPEPAAETSEVEVVRQQLTRLQADFDNFRKRTRQEREELQRYATRKLLAELLPVVDNFDRAAAALTAPDAELETVRTGVEMVHRQLLTLLSQHDVTPMDAVGKPFDPKVHEGVMQEPAGDGPAGVVVAELQKGYWLDDRVLRPAMVTVTV